MKIAAFLVMMGFALGLMAEEAPAKGVKYKAADKINFETLLIEGQNKRPDIAIVTGNIGNEGDGLLKLRENFLDQVAVDAGESIK